MTYTRTMDAALFLVFLGRLLRQHDRKGVRDRGPPAGPRDARVADWGVGHRDRIELFYLPRVRARVERHEYLNNEPEGGGE